MEKDAERRDLEPAKLESGSIPTLRLETAPFTEGEIIGDRYRVERIIAEGGMGVVVAARHLELEETVAIKFLKGEFATKPEIVGRFAREAKAAAKIRCEYTAIVHDVGISPRRGPYIVMEYLEGEDLESVLQADGRLPFARATELMMQAGEAIGVAHAAGVIHRDIKPANLFLVRRAHGVPILKVLDFGVSKTALTGNVFGGTISLVKTQSLVGSPIYMSPEQLRGGNEIGFTADVWSLGAVLYELITGETAFTGATITELCAAVLESEPLSIAERVPDVPSGLADAIMRCLMKNPRDRWQSVAELVVALAPYAPKRARMSVDRVVAVSKAAGLLSHAFDAPTTLTPPPSGNTAPIPSLRLAPPPQSLLETVTEGPTTSLSAYTTRATDGEDVAVDFRPSQRRALFIGFGLLGAAAVMGILFVLGRGPETEAREPSKTTTATAPATTAPPADPPSAPVSIATTQHPASPTSAMPAPPTVHPRLGPTEGRRSPASLPPTAPANASGQAPPPPSALASASAAPVVPPVTPASVAPKVEPTRSAIEDRK